MSFVTVRHFTEADIPIRTELMRESAFQANLTDFAVASGDDALVASQRRTITSEHATKRIFTLCAPKGEPLGFAWITSIDWRSRTCELSFGVLPRYRGAYGVSAVVAANEHLRLELGMRVVVNQVLDHNHMFQSAENVAASRRVHCEYDSYTVGQWRAAGYWTHTVDDVRAETERARQRRRELADRIRARSARAS